MISNIAESRNSDCNKSNTEPDSQNIRNIKINTHLSEKFKIFV